MERSQDDHKAMNEYEYFQNMDGLEIEMSPRAMMYVLGTFLVTVNRSNDDTAQRQQPNPKSVSLSFSYVVSW